MNFDFFIEQYVYLSLFMKDKHFKSWKWSMLDFQPLPLLVLSCPF